MTSSSIALGEIMENYMSPRNHVRPSDVEVVIVDKKTNELHTPWEQLSPSSSVLVSPVSSIASTMSFHMEDVDDLCVNNNASLASDTETDGAWDTIKWPGDSKSKVEDGPSLTLDLGSNLPIEQDNNRQLINNSHQWAPVASTSQPAGVPVPTSNNLSRAGPAEAQSDDQCEGVAPTIETDAPTDARKQVDTAHVAKIDTIAFPPPTPQPNSADRIALENFVGDMAVCEQDPLQLVDTSPPIALALAPRDQEWSAFATEIPGDDPPTVPPHSRELAGNATAITKDSPVMAPPKASSMPDTSRSSAIVAPTPSTVVPTRGNPFDGAVTKPTEKTHRVTSAPLASSAAPPRWSFQRLQEVARSKVQSIAQVLPTTSAHQVHKLGSLRGCTYPTSMVLLPFHFESVLRAHGAAAAFDALSRGWSAAQTLLQSGIHALRHQPTPARGSGSWYYLYLVDEVQGTLVVLPRHAKSSMYPLVVGAESVGTFLPFLAAGLHMVHSVQPIDDMPSDEVVQTTLVHLRAAQAALRHPSLQYMDVLTEAIGRAKGGDHVSSRRVHEVARRDLHLAFQALDPSRECSGLESVVEPTTGVPLWTFKASLPPPLDRYVRCIDDQDWDTDEFLEEMSLLCTAKFCRGPGRGQERVCECTIS